MKLDRINALASLLITAALLLLQSCSKQYVDVPLTSRVVDAETGGPVQDAYILYRKIWRVHGLAGELFGQSEFSRSFISKTDAQGIFTVPETKIKYSGLYEPFMLRLLVFKQGYGYKELMVNVSSSIGKLNENEESPNDLIQLASVPSTIHLYPLKPDDSPCRQWEKVDYETPFFLGVNRIVEGKLESRKTAIEAQKALEDFHDFVEDHDCSKKENINKMNIGDLSDYLDKNPEVVNDASPDGSTPLLNAAVFGDVETVKLLLDKGADVNAMTDWGTPLYMATLNEKTEVVKLLLEHGADPNIPKRTGSTPLHAAIGRGNRSIVILLLAAGADPNAVASGGLTPLHICAIKGREEYCEVLLKHGAVPSLTLKDHKGKTPLDVANDMDHRKAYDLMNSYLYR